MVSYLQKGIDKFLFHSKVRQMQIYEYLTIAISFLAIIVSIIAYKKASASAEGSIELYINQRISDTRSQVLDVSMRVTDLLDKKERPTAFIKILHAAIENNLDAYEDACAKYLDGKVDRVRFKKLYETSIKQLVEDETHKPYFSSPQMERYKAIKAVYQQWNNQKGNNFQLVHENP